MDEGITMKNEYTFQKDYTWARRVREQLENAGLMKSFEEANRIFSIVFKHGDQFAHEMGRLIMAASLNYMYERGSQSFREFFQEDTSYLLGAQPKNCNGNGSGFQGIEDAVEVLERYLDAADPESWSLLEKDFEFDWPVAVICQH
jgi:hypothetical protein